MKYDHFLRQKIYLCANTRFDHDGQTDLDLRSNERFTRFHGSDLLFNLESVDDYLYQSRTDIRMPVSEQLSVSTQVNVDYDAAPAPGCRQENDRYGADFQAGLRASRAGVGIV
jgi:hypothetical protein